MKHFSLLTIAAATMLFAGCDLIADKAQPVDYVNNRIGNISHLLVPTYPTAQLPNSMLRMIWQSKESVSLRFTRLRSDVLEKIDIEFFDS